MTPSARIQSAIDLLDEIILAARTGGASADSIAKAYFRARRYMGSKDRRAVRETAYQAIRRFGVVPDSGRAAMLGLLDDHAEFDGSQYGPPLVQPDEPIADGPVIASWMQDLLNPLVAAEGSDALLERATFDLRVNPKQASQADVLAHWSDAAFHPALPLGFHLTNGLSVEDSPLWQSGGIEVQDFGSQAIVAACLADQPLLVIDLCAGAGGKALSLAAQMPDDARIIASDINRKRLDAMEPRRRRAGALNIQPMLLNPNKEWADLQSYGGMADLVLVDAPCSGSGTWRRNPETRWRLTPQRLQRIQVDQAKLLDLAARLVRPGGYLVYAVCSLFDVEGVDQISNFLSRNREYTIALPDMLLGRAIPEPSTASGILLTPTYDASDGFFFTRMRKL